MSCVAIPVLLAMGTDIVLYLNLLTAGRMRASMTS